MEQDLFIIIDWVFNRIKPNLYFNNFYEAWDYILFELTDELNLNENDYQEYSVIRYNLYKKDKGC